MTTSKSRNRIRVQAIIPEDWLPRLREVVEKRGYYSLSEFICDLIMREIGDEN